MRRALTHQPKDQQERLLWHHEGIAVLSSGKEPSYDDDSRTGGAPAHLIHRDGGRTCPTLGLCGTVLKLTGALFAQALVFGWLANPTASVPELAAAAALAGVSISPQGLDKRCTSAAADLLESLLMAAVQVVVHAEQVAIPLLERFTAVELLDASTLVLPDALADWWPGCGGSSTTNTSAALKIHVRYDLCQGTLRGPLLTDGRTHESTTPLQTAPLPRGALRVADLGYFCLAVLAAIADEGAFFLSRMHHATAVFTPHGQRVRLLDLLGPAPSYDFSGCWAARSACRCGCWLSASPQRWPTSAVVA